MLAVGQELSLLESKMAVVATTQVAMLENMEIFLNIFEVKTQKNAVIDKNH